MRVVYMSIAMHITCHTLMLCMQQLAVRKFHVLFALKNHDFVFSLCRFWHKKLLHVIFDVILEEKLLHAIPDVLLEEKLLHVILDVLLDELR